MALSFFGEASAIVSYQPGSKNFQTRIIQYYVIRSFSIDLEDVKGASGILTINDIHKVHGRDIKRVDSLVCIAAAGELV